MIDYKSNITILKRLVANSESKLFPRMKKRKDYLDNLIESNKDVPALNAEADLNNQLREHVQLLMNYIIYLEGFIEKNISEDTTEESEYIKILENELLHDFRKRNNIAK